MFSKNPGVILPSGVDPYSGVSRDGIKELATFNLPSRFNEGKAFWLKYYPKCSRSKRMVATDFTPTYLYDPEVPERMRMFYGDQSDAVKFGVVLRNPLHRMHSAFWYFKNGLGRPLCVRKDIDVSFQEYAIGVLAGQDPCGLVHLAHYAAQLEEYMKVFSPPQFTIMLFKQITEPPAESMTVINDLWESLGLQRGLPTAVVKENMYEEEPTEKKQLGSLPHPALQDDLDANTLVQLQAYMETTVGADELAEFLGTFISADQKPTLARYSGPWDKAPLAEWIEANW